MSIDFFQGRSVASSTARLIKLIEDGKGARWTIELSDYWRRGFKGGMDLSFWNIIAKFLTTGNLAIVAVKIICWSWSLVT